MLACLSVYQIFSGNLLMTLTHSSFLLEDVHILHNDIFSVGVDDNMLLRSRIYSRAKTKGNTKCTPCSLQINFI